MYAIRSYYALHVSGDIQGDRPRSTVEVIDRVGRGNLRKFQHRFEKRPGLQRIRLEKLV